MRVFPLAGVLAAAVLAPTTARPQAYSLPAPPLTTAAPPAAQTADTAIFYAGRFYVPSGPDVFFDGRVMFRVGAAGGVPLYEDATLAPYSVVYVPIGRGLMRPYEPREATAPPSAGTPGARFEPFETPTDRQAATEPVATGGRMESIPRPRGNRGIFVEYAGGRWYRAGRAVPFDAAAFVEAGTYHGFTVYRRKESERDEIFIPAVKGGPLTPYRR